MKNRKVTQETLNMVCVLVALAITVLILCAVISGAARAQAAQTESPHKYYTSVCIQQGDTLWTIAGHYRTAEYRNMDAYIREICELNRIEASDIHYGQYIVVPYYSRE